MSDDDSGPVLPADVLDRLARMTLEGQTLETVMGAVAELARDTVPGADEVSVTLLRGRRASTVACTGPLAVELDERQYELGHGPCLDGTAAGELVHVADMTTEQRWPDYTPAAVARGVLSSISVPVPLQREVSAALNVYGTKPHAFDDSSTDLARAFAAYAGVALANMHLHEAQVQAAQQLQTAMESRAVIEQAKGILMGARRCDAEAAFDLLVTLSQESNRKLRDVAQALVDSARPDR